MGESARIKVLNITEEGRGGGGMRRIRLIARELQPYLDTIVVAPKSATQYLSDLRSDHIQYAALPLRPLTKHPFGLLQYLVYFISEVRSLIKLIRLENPDIVHVNGSWQIKGSIAAKATKKPCIWHMNDTYQPRVIEKIFRMMSKNATHMIYASEAAQKYYTDINPALTNLSSRIIQAPVMLDNFLRKDESTAQSPLRIINVGYINIHKGLKYLLEMAYLLGDQVTVHHFGPVLDSQKTYYQSLLDLQQRLGINNFTWHGYNSNLGQILHKYDLYVCSSIREASPMAVWEAMAAGLPILSTEVGDVRRIIDRYKCGLTVTAADSKALAQGVEKIRAGLRQGAYHPTLSITTAKEQFDVASIANQYFDFLTEICETTA
ncbi:MAG: glycosyltransferase [Bacteroidota bacterium]